MAYSCAPPLRVHTVTQSDNEPKLHPATEPPVADSHYTSRIENEWRIITSNAIPEHHTGEFPNKGNPNAISEKKVDIRIPAHPRLSNLGVPHYVKEPGWALNGVKFDPGTREFYLGAPSLQWNYNALSGAVPLGIDENYAHVQPNGAYHYHGLPTLFLESLKVSPGVHSPLVGWAADGFPIYAQFGYREGMKRTSGVIEMTSSWQLKAGNRPVGDGNPGGNYDGTFTQDYEYIEGSGLLDECNGRITATPDFPEGTYAYFLTSSWPVVPRCLRGLQPSIWRD